ncbi:cysteine hydrolase family protein [Brachybacterium sp. ACRRE]|uniref:cysteine hydrolase family protein n=1 Tax=Brachybacterium sp. ACRRE TaxID=2918184 RepID=UPI001EF17FF2|nr:cysteine hydrolase [Brachybacterium sp. ACRRE]MCG7310181.1 cysteine hydrolase [Brachybacterium sp. ACRRE]
MTAPATDSRKTTGPASRTVLLAMDFQHGIADRFTSTGVLERARAAVEVARDSGIPVVWVRVAFRPGYPEIAPTSGFAGISARAGETGMTEDSPATALHEALDPGPEEPVVIKRRISAFTGSDLEVLLRGLQAESLVLAGISTSGVVLSTLRQAADLDFRLTVLADACADPDEEVHRVLTQKVFPRQATVTTVDEWAEGLAGA